MNADKQPAALGAAAPAFAAPLAIAMWDFSWLERRWPGAGYEDWDRALDELLVRGYNAVRIDAFPHLLARDPHAAWALDPVWDQHDWGSPAKTRVQVQPALNTFIEKCALRGIKVALSTWWRDDSAYSHCRFSTPQEMAAVWLATLASIEEAGLLGHILFVDLTNEYPIFVSTPYFPRTAMETMRTADHNAWMGAALAPVRARYPALPLTFSFTGDYWHDYDLALLDFLELHIWMTNKSDFNRRIGYEEDFFRPTGYEIIAARAEKTYREDPQHWQEMLRQGIDTAVARSRQSGRMLMTTECWGIVAYKDWPGLDWGWVKELCALGTQHAAQSGRFLAIATSNFCGPQFRGMWRDVAWHQRLTAAIRSARIDW